MNRALDHISNTGSLVRIDGPLSGAENMSIDEGLLLRAVDGRSAIRFYRWSAPTISLGHFQQAPAALAGSLAGLPVVRRLSGGGAILHDRELTYSCALPAGHPLCGAPARLYEAAHAAIIETLREDFGIESRLRGAGLPGDDAFLCYARGDARDIVIGNRKIVGSAQRRRRGAVLQHGSILLAASDRAPQFPGLWELTGKLLTAGDLSERLAERFAVRLFPDSRQRS